MTALVISHGPVRLIVQGVSGQGSVGMTNPPNEHTNRYYQIYYVICTWSIKELNISLYSCRTYYKWSNLTLMRAHLPVKYTLISVTGKWLAIACKCWLFTFNTFFWDMNYSLVWILVKSRTDRQTDRRKVMPMSPLCICTGVLNKKAERILQIMHYLGNNPLETKVISSFNF